MENQFIFEGLSTTDILVRPNTVVDLHDDGVELKHGPSGQEWFIPTNGKPEAGAKVVAKEPLRPLLGSPIVEKVVAGGGVVAAGAACANRIESHKVLGKVSLLNSGNETPELTAICDAMGIDCHSYQRQRSPVNIVLPLDSDRLVIKEPLTATFDGLADGHAGRVASLVRGCSALTSVSAKDPGLAALAASMSNGARHYFQPTGSLNPELTLFILSVATEAVCNLEEWKLMAKWASVAVPNRTKNSNDVHKAAAHLLSAMYERGFAGKEAAVCTLGAKGCVAADWVKERLSSISFDMTNNGPPTPVGAGDRFLGEWVFLRETWSRQGHLRHPVEATAVRITHSIANAVGLDRGRYDVVFRSV